MSELQELCNRLIAIGVSTGHADNFESLAVECVDNIEELKEEKDALQTEYDAYCRVARAMTLGVTSEASDNE